jgi:hypothetical protein
MNILHVYRIGTRYHTIWAVHHVWKEGTEIRSSSAEVGSANEGLYVFVKAKILRPVLYVEFWSRRMQLRQ